jgi:hypothetical protein
MRGLLLLALVGAALAAPSFEARGESDVALRGAGTRGGEPYGRRVLTSARAYMAEQAKAPLAWQPAGGSCRGGGTRSRRCEC